ncbi:hypothetical protein J2I47_02375 [Fibrella sp. HMF5335]|uniref:Uncharacterized protein n=1 Tax=Fibrella rubiginis TaxID=2817060 RepID=A0A939GBM2_9BACT|nr:hypothetical protein [Fibrella rubiginis]MBO0935386.1 hypothetical protein [Fibrella rubiginis]
MMTSYLRPSLRVLIWSLLVALCLNHFTTSLNPFQGLVVLVLITTAVLVQLVLLRRKGWVYVGTFLLWLIVLTTIFSYIDGRIYDHPRRYYSIQK